MTQATALVTVGAPVFSNDGVHLGHVKRVDRAGGWFKLDAPQRPDFWLPLGDVLEVGKQYVLLRTRQSQVRDRKWEGPEPQPPAISAEGTDRDLPAD